MELDEQGVEVTEGEAAVEVAEAVAVQSVSGCSCLSVKIVIYFQVDY